MTTLLFMASPLLSSNLPFSSLNFAIIVSRTGFFNLRFARARNGRAGCPCLPYSMIFASKGLMPDAYL